MKTKIILNSALMILLSGCQTIAINGNHNEIPVNSEPSGASVYVMGELLGVTPMVVNVSKLYPVTYSNENKDLYGRIVLRHKDCDDRTVRVSNNTTEKGIKESLTCSVGEVVKPTVTKGMTVKESQHEDDSTKIEKTIRQRLREVKILKDEGLIDEKEYQQVKSRILQAL